MRSLVMATFRYLVVRIPGCPIGCVPIGSPSHPRRVSMISAVISSCRTLGRLQCRKVPLDLAGCRGHRLHEPTACENADQHRHDDDPSRARRSGRVGAQLMDRPRAASAASVRTTCTRYVGTIHDFVMLNPAARGAIGQAVAALESALA
jgi:hypothetical protein